MIGSFIAGAVASTFICGYLGGKTIWCADILLLIVFFALLRADSARSTISSILFRTDIDDKLYSFTYYKIK